MVGDAVRAGVCAQVTGADPTSVVSVEPEPHRALAIEEGEVLAWHDVCAIAGTSSGTYRSCGRCLGSCSCAGGKVSRLLMLRMCGDDSTP